MRGSSNNNIAEQWLRVPGGPSCPRKTVGGKKISKTAVEEVTFLGTKLISEF